MHAYIDSLRPNNNVWFGINLYSEPERAKKFCQKTNLLWADLDDCPPTEIEPPPQVVIESSPGRWQGIWRLDESIDPYIAEDYSRRLYNGHKDKGVDSGWALTKLLRVPGTENLKYADRPSVELKQASEPLLAVTIFDALAEVQEIEVDEAEIPDELPDAENVLYKYQGRLRQNNFFQTYAYEPNEDDDWSKLLWRLLLICFESGLSAEESYAVALTSNFDKYERDGRPTRFLWRDVLKAEAHTNRVKTVTTRGRLGMPELIPGDSFKLKPSFIDEYRQWGEEKTDAPAIYHDLSAFILLSSLLSANIKLETSYGTLRPNLWGLVLGETTITRKSTAMRMATGIISDIDDDIVLATDASAEGLLSGLQSRSGRTSVFFRDEVTGFFSSIQKKDYLSGLPELLTQLYDCPPILRRRLRKELISISDPIFIFFGGGIEDRIYTILDETHILSGFLPRFLIVSGEADLARIRRTGPPTQQSIEQGQAIYAKLHGMYHDYITIHETTVLGQKASMPVDVEAILTNDAWELYGDIEYRLVEAASNSANPTTALPTFNRLAVSMLKMSVLVASTQREPVEELLQVDVDDIRHAAKYIQHWGNFTVDLVENIGQTINGRMYMKALDLVQQNPGLLRGELMRLMNLNKREVTEIQDTLEARGQINVVKEGKGVRYHASA